MHTFDSPGTYDVSLTVTDDDGGSGTDNLVVQVSSVGILELEATRDSFLRPGDRNTNEGANPRLSIKESGSGREVVVGFGMSGVSLEGLVRATLVLTIDPGSLPDNWGSGGYVDAHRLLAEWIEGNGVNSEVPPSQRYRGDGTGVTWNCAVDSDISDQDADCDPTWNGGDYAPVASDSVLHVNGMVGEVMWDVTADVLTGADSWLLRRAPGGGGNVLYFSKEGDEPAPKLVLEYVP